MNLRCGKCHRTHDLALTNKWQQKPVGDEWDGLVSPALGRLKQKGGEFQASLSQVCPCGQAQQCVFVIFLTTVTRYLAEID